MAGGARKDDHVYSTVDDTQGQMFMVSSNPAYGTITNSSCSSSQATNGSTLDIMVTSGT